MKIYVTFGQSHRHIVRGVEFDRDTVAEIECETYDDGRAKAFDVFGPKFCFCYDEKPTMEFFPKGIVKLWD